MKENIYYIYRRIKGAIYSIVFFVFRCFPIKKNKIVVCCFFGEMGYGCSAKYIIERLVSEEPQKYEIVWLVKDLSKEFPPYIKKIKYTWLSNAYHLSTAKIWIDNEKKALGVKKRAGQIYINTWHGPIGFKTVGALRKEKWSKVGKKVSSNDCKMTDYYLSNSIWCTNIHTAAYPYGREVVHEIGMPRTDPLINDVERCSQYIRQKNNIPQDAKIVIYAPTFRGGIQKTHLSYDLKVSTIDFDRLCTSLKSCFGGEWYIFLKLHPMVSAHIEEYPDMKKDNRIINISKEDDLYENIAAADALITDFSSCAFDASYKKIPVFMYADDYDEYISARELYWDMKELPFSLSKNNEELEENILSFNMSDYLDKLDKFFEQVGLVEKGNASKIVCDYIRSCT